MIDYWRLLFESSLLLVLHLLKFLLFGKSLCKFTFIMVSLTWRRNTIIFAIGHIRHLTLALLQGRIISEPENSQPTEFFSLLIELIHEWILIFWDKLIFKWLGIGSSNSLFLVINVHVFFIFFLFLCFPGNVVIGVLLQDHFEWGFYFFNFSGCQVLIEMQLIDV